MNRIEKNWLKFREKVISADAGEGQVTDMRHSFYAGVMTVLSITEEATNETEQVGETMIGNMYNEMARYRLKVLEEACACPTTK
jgi:hypothetical protein